MTSEKGQGFGNIDAKFDRDMPTFAQVRGLEELITEKYTKQGIKDVKVFIQNYICTGSDGPVKC
jgi:hypothetical protein